MKHMPTIYIYIQLPSNNNINKTIQTLMRTNTQYSEFDDKKSISTRVTPAAKSASFTVNAKRQIFLQKTNQHNQIQKLYNNVLVLNPEASAYVVSERVMPLDDDQQFVVLHDGFYTLMADRGKTNMMTRTVEPQSQLLFWNAKKPGKTIFLQSLHKYSNKDDPSMLHVNITKHNPEQSTTESQNIHLPLAQHKQVLSFTTLQNSKKCLLLTEHNQSLQFMYFSLTKENKLKNAYFKHNKNNMKKFGEASDDEEDEETRLKKQEQKQYIIGNIETIVSGIKLQREDQRVVKIMNSEYGDALLLVSNKEIYNIEIEGRDLEIKPIKLQQQIKIYKSQMQNIKEEGNQCEQLVDSTYIFNGLKILFITKSNKLGYIAAEKIIGLIDISQQLAKKEKNRKYADNLEVIQVLSMVEKVIVRTSNNQLIVLKELFESHRAVLTVEKVLEVGVDWEAGWTVTVAPKSEDIIISKVVNDLQKKISHLEVGKKSLHSPGNEFQIFYRSGYKQPLQSQPSTTLPSLSQQKTPIYSAANGIMCSIKGHQLNFLRIFQGFTTQKNYIQQLFTVSYFERPLRVSMDPYGSMVIVLFKEFVKIFKFQYQCLQPLYTYNVRGVNYAGFSDSGQYILIAVEDTLHFINPFTFEDQKQIQAYGEIRSIKYFDTSLYILLKNKVSSKSSLEQYIHSYIQTKGTYKKISQLKLQPNQISCTDRKHLIICSQTKISIYYYDYFQHENAEPIQKLKTKNISFLDHYEYPTAVTLCEEFGVLFVGTNFGRVYQYLWPILDSSEEFMPNQYYVRGANNDEISAIRVGTCLEKVFTFSQSGMITLFQINQYIQGQQMNTPYTISPQTLYTSHLKYQFASRQYLYQNHTAYIQQYKNQTNQQIQQLKFILQKMKDDIDQQNSKANYQLMQSIEQQNRVKESDVRELKVQFEKTQGNMVMTKEYLDRELEECEEHNTMVIGELTEKYQKKMLELYKEADRLRGIMRDLNKRFTHEKDRYRIENDKIKEELACEYQQELQVFEQKFQSILKTASQYNKQMKIEKEQSEVEKEEYRKYRHREVEQQLQCQERVKQGLLGSIQQFIKQINNYKQRKGEFDSLTMQTNLQIDQLYKDRVEYTQKKQYLHKQLQNKQEMIEEKEKELIVFVKNTDMMKKIKNTHEFQLKEYEKEFEPMNVKLRGIQEKIKNMNAEIFKEFSDRQVAQENIKESKGNIFKLKRKIQLKILKKHTSKTKLNKLFSQLTALLEKDPLSLQLRKKLNDLVFGQTFQSNEEEVLQKEKNAKLMRKKDFIRKEIQEEEKREQQIVRNKNLYFHYYNDNTSLVSYYNELKQEANKLDEIQTKLVSKIEDMRNKINMEATSKNRRIESGRSRSLLESANKKFSQKLLTPYQRYEQEQVDLIWAKGNTQQTRLGSISSRKNLQSSNLLHTLVKDLKNSQSTYQKMQAVRNRVRSFVNPELRIRNPKKNNLGVQRMLFETRKLVQENQ